MGNKCNCVGRNQSTDEAEDALLGTLEQQRSRQQQQGGHQQQNRIMRLPGRQVTRNVTQTPREPPPPYQQVRENNNGRNKPTSIQC